MTRSSLAAMLVAALVVGVPGRAPVSAQDKANLAGRWTLNRSLSQFPGEVGFGADLVMGAGTSGGSAGGGGKGRGGSSGGTVMPAPPRLESEDDVKRAQQLTEEVRTPSAYLTVVDTPTGVTVTDDRGHARAFRADGKDDVVQLDDVPVATNAKWEAGRLVVLYKVEQGRELRYTYSRTVSPSQLVVEVRFLERNGRDSVKRVYEPASTTEPWPPAAAPRPAPAPAPLPPWAAKPAGGGLLPGSSGSNFGKPPLPESQQSTPPPPTFDQRPDAELKGINALGVVVEDLSPQAAACGLNQGTIETAVARSLTDAGFKVQRNSDEDTYVYVNIITSSVSAGLCISRYDTFLYTHTTAKLSYGETPVLVQVSLAHKGGLAGGGPAAHAKGVLQGVQEYVDQLATRIRAANK